eukprot:5821051-Pyramimonas_sp.AAC.1
MVISRKSLQELVFGGAAFFPTVRKVSSGYPRAPNAGAGWLTPLGRGWSPLMERGQSPSLAAVAAGVTREGA